MDMNTKIYGVTGLHCAGCVDTVEKALLDIEGVHTASVNLTLENVSIIIDSKITFDKLNDAVHDYGYALVEETTDKFTERTIG